MTPQELSDYWDLATTHRDRAQAEAYISEYFEANNLVIGPSYSFLQDVIKNPRISCHSFKNRRYLWLFGDAAECMWTAIEEPNAIPIWLAVELCRQAKKEPGDLKSNIEAVLHGYLQASPEEQKRIRNFRKINEKPKHLKAPRVEWKEIQKSILDRISKNVPPNGAGQGLLKRFENDLTSLFASWQSELNSTRANKTLNGALPTLPTVSRSKLIAAARIMRLDPPKPGIKVDLGAANRVKRKLLRLYHPDTNGGNDSLIHLFHEANEAYRILENYNESLEEKDQKNVND